MIYLVYLHHGEFYSKWRRLSYTNNGRHLWDDLQQTQTLPATGKNIWFWGLRLCTFVWLVELFVCFGNIQWLYIIIRGKFLIQSKYAEFDIVIKSCTAERGYWQYPVDYILTETTSVFLCMRPSAATIVFDAKYDISPSNSGLVLFIIYVAFTVYTLKCVTFPVAKINADDMAMPK